MARSTTENLPPSFTSSSTTTTVIPTLHYSTPHLSITWGITIPSQGLRQTGFLPSNLSFNPEHPNCPSTSQPITRKSSQATMSRSAADATRFTATGPYANSKPGTSPSSASSAGSPSSRLPYKLPSFMTQDKTKPNNQPKNNHIHNNGPNEEINGSGSGRKETARERVDRLRAQTRAARMAQGAGTGVDRMIERGRRVANRAHKTMVYALIATSGKPLSCITIDGANRRDRRLWCSNRLLHDLSNSV